MCLPHPCSVSSVHGMMLSVRVEVSCISEKPGMGPCTDVFILVFTRALFA